MDPKRLAAIRRAVSDAIKDVDPAAQLSHRPDLLNPGRTTVHLADVTRDELRAWCRLHKVSPASLQRALHEHDIGTERGTPKTFIIRRSTTRKPRHYFVEVHGHRPRPGRRAREELRAAQAQEETP